MVRDNMNPSAEPPAGEVSASPRGTSYYAMGCTSAQRAVVTYIGSGALIWAAICVLVGAALDAFVIDVAALVLYALARAVGRGSRGACCWCCALLGLYGFGALGIVVTGWIAPEKLLLAGGPLNAMGRWLVTWIAAIVLLCSTAGIYLCCKALRAARALDRVRNGLCPVCGYDVTRGQLARCPECGFQWAHQP